MVSHEYPNIYKKVLKTTLEMNLLYLLIHKGVLSSA
jgi:hypothetical protein